MPQIVRPRFEAGKLARLRDECSDLGSRVATLSGTLALPSPRCYEVRGAEAAWLEVAAKAARPRLFSQ